MARSKSFSDESPLTNEWHCGILKTCGLDFYKGKRLSDATGRPRTERNIVPRSRFDHFHGDDSGDSGMNPGSRQPGQYREMAPQQHDFKKKQLMMISITIKIPCMALEIH